MASTASQFLADSRPDTGSSRPFLRLAECAEILGCSVSTTYRMAHQGRLPVIRRRGGFFVPRDALVAFLSAEAEAALENLKPNNRPHRAADDARKNKEPRATTLGSTKGGLL